jgi:hypothetical protein
MNRYRVKEAEEEEKKKEEKTTFNAFSSLQQ